MKLIQWQILSVVTPPVWPEHCAPELFDTRAEQATAGLRRQQTHLHVTSHLSAADSRTVADRRLHVGSCLYPSAVSAQLFTGLLHWQDRMSPPNAQKPMMKTTRWVKQTKFPLPWCCVKKMSWARRCPGLLTVTSAQTYLALPCKYTRVFVIERARLSPHVCKWVILMDDRLH